MSWPDVWGDWDDWKQQQRPRLREKERACMYVCHSYFPPKPHPTTGAKQTSKTRKFVCRGHMTSSSSELCRLVSHSGAACHVGSISVQRVSANMSAYDGCGWRRNLPNTNSLLSKKHQQAEWRNVRGYGRLSSCVIYTSPPEGRGLLQHDTLVITKPKHFSS